MRLLLRGLQLTLWGLAAIVAVALAFYLFGLLFHLAFDLFHGH